MRLERVEEISDVGPVAEIARVIKQCHTRIRLLLKPRTDSREEVRFV